MLHVVGFKQLDTFRLQCTFSNGVVKEIDFARHWHDFAGPIFQPLHNPEFFQKVTLPPDSETIEWPNGADVAAEFLFNIGETVLEQQSAPLVPELIQ
jgi:hypothetical protein